MLRTPFALYKHNFLCLEEEGRINDKNNPFLMEIICCSTYGKPRVRISIGSISNNCYRKMTCRIFVGMT